MKGSNVSNNLIPRVRGLQFAWDGLLARVVSGERPFNHPLRVLVRELDARSDDGAADPLRADLPFGCHVPDDGEREAVGARVEAAEVLAEEVREHGEHPLHEVHARGPLRGDLVQRRLGLDEVRDVRDVDSDPEEAAGERLDAQGVVEVAGSQGIDREHPGRPEVPPFGQLVLGDRPGDGREAVEGVLREVCLDDALGREDCCGLRLDLTRLPDGLADLCERLKAPR
mmetsp:Transcript_25385/g.60375  ORF Transcript_25385/g.60375 Transcript_25385/m.60375 type:complete len:227 (-) Transcript_25385:1809-2489(-)